jgi:hypothetical protein
VVTTRADVRTTEQLFKPPAEPTDPSQLFVRARAFQVAPINQRILATLLMRCRCCDLSRLLPLAVVQDTGMIATRQRDYISDGTVTDTATGKEPAASPGG